MLISWPPSTQFLQDSRTCTLLEENGTRLRQTILQRRSARYNVFLRIFHARSQVHAYLGVW